MNNHKVEEEIERNLVFVIRFFEAKDCPAFKAAEEDVFNRQQYAKRHLQPIADKYGSDGPVFRNDDIIGFMFSGSNTPDQKVWLKPKTERIVVKGKPRFVQVCKPRREIARGREIADAIDGITYPSTDTILDSIGLKKWRMIVHDKIRSANLLYVGSHRLVTVPETNDTRINGENGEYSCQREKYLPVEGMVELKASEYYAIIEKHGEDDE